MSEGVEAGVTRSRRHRRGDRPQVLASTPGARGVPPGWPPGVPPAVVEGWEQDAVAWLLDQCPADYRGYGVWRRHPAALAWVTVRHLSAQIEGMRQAWRGARAGLGPLVAPDALDGVLGCLGEEGLRLRTALRSAELVLEHAAGSIPPAVRDE